MTVQQDERRRSSRGVNARKIAQIRTIDGDAVPEPGRELQPAGSNPTATVAKGDGQIPFSQTLTLPASGVSVVKVMYVLSPTGGFKTTIIAAYPVE